MTIASTVDPRGPRVAAGITTAVLAVAIVTQNAWVVAAQGVVFALGAVGRSPYQLLFKTVVRPRLGRPDELEPAAPVRFAQAVGLVFAIPGAIGFAAGSAPVGFVFTGFALAAAFLNVAFGLCLGCELFLLIARSTGRPVIRRVPVS